MQISVDVGRVLSAVPRTSVKEMLTVTETDGKVHVRVNSSSLSLLLNCGRKSWYVLERKLVSHNESPATLFGSAIHAALEEFYSAPREERRIPANFREVSDLIPNDHTNVRLDNLLHRSIKRFCEKAAPLRGLEASDKRSLAAGVWTLQNYFETYIDDPFEVLCDKDGPITERYCEAPLYESADLNITLFGTIDVILENKQTGVILPADHKTSSIVGNDFYNRLRPNHQYTGYIYLAQKCLGVQADSFLVNVLQVKPKPKTSRGGPPHFPRQVTTRSASDIEEFTDTVVSAVRNYLTWKRDDTWPMGDVLACTAYGGCNFLDVCGSPKSIRENIIEAKFSAGT